MKNSSFLLAASFLLFHSCENFVDHAYFIKVRNNSNYAVRCYASYNYPDTSLNVSKPSLQLITPQSYTTIESKDKWDRVLPKDTIEIFIIKEDTLIKYDWNIIRDNYKISKRFDLSIDDINKSGSIVNYP